MRLQLQRLEQLVSAEHHVVLRLERGWPVLVHLESRATDRGMMERAQRVWLRPSTM